MDLTQNLATDDLGAPVARVRQIGAQRPRVVRAKRSKRAVDNEAFAAFVERIMRAYARRIETGDIEGLADMKRIADQVDSLIGSSVRRLVEEEGYSWADVGRVLGVKRQSAHERYARPRSA